MFVLMDLARLWPEFHAAYAFLGASVQRLGELRVFGQIQSRMMKDDLERRLERFEEDPKTF